MNKFKIWMSGIFALILIAMVALSIILIYYEYDNPRVILPLIAIGLVLDACFAFSILNSPRYPIIKLCWVFVVLAFPFLGCVIFTIFGTTPFKRKKWKEYNKLQANFVRNEKFYKKNQLNLTKEEYNIFAFAKNNSFRPIYKNNRIKVIEYNNDLYKQSIELIKSAKSTIHIQMYILRDGFWLKSIVNELIKKSRDGVKVRLIYDWVGSLNRVPKKLLKELRKNGVSVAVFNPHGINIFKGATNYRSHRKCIIIDNRKALFGGSNIGDEYLAIDKKTNFFKDLNFVVEGEIVNSLNLLFCQDYCFMSDIKKNSKEFNEVYKNLNNILIPQKVNNELYCQVVDSSPDYEGKSIKNEIINLILKAKKSISIITPYFFPTDDIVDSLIIAGQIGIDVKLLVPGKNDNKTFVTLLNRSYYNKLTDAKVKIYEYNGFIHSKLIIIDDQYVFTGSFNLDYRSLWINFENAILFKDRDISKKLKTTFNENIKNSVKVNKQFIRNNTSRLGKIKISFMNVFYPLL